ncbi:DUF6344 domain-containing protein [Streptomyces sp. NPDC047000]|uniref:DUF6344 domain-containing protein n=1 Tax=Streptomyces sp. NPDC047000 TaxID=3155474 RepID=UPI0033C8A93C
MAAQNKVMKLWTSLITALLALCTALGLITTTAATAAARTEPAHEGTAHAKRPAPRNPTVHHRVPRARALPPTMKQRIGAEAHGKSPSCRHRPLGDATEAEEAATGPEARIPAQAQAQTLQRC